MSEDLEARLLASVPSIGHFQNLEERGIVESSFNHYGPMFTYMKTIIDEHEHLPRLHDLKQTFNIPSHVQRKPEEFEWLLEEFLNLSIIQRIQETLDTNIEKHGDTPQDLLSSLVRDLTGLAVPNKRHASVTDLSAGDRIKEYEDKISDEPIMGIPTGLSYFDSDYRIGWMPGELNAIIGRTHIGKSWMLLYHGVLAWKFGKRVMLLSPEMSQEEAESRIDTIVCGMYGVNIDVNDLIRGTKLNDKQRNVLNEMSKRGDWVTICSDGDRPMTLGEIPRYVRQYNPDLVLVDGMTLIGTKSEAGWAQANDLSQGLKNIAASLSVSILVCQWANQKAGDGTTPPKLSHVYMGDSLAQASDRIVSLFQPKGEIGLRVSIQKFRKGRPKVKALKFKFDPSHGLIYELKPEDNLSENVEDVVEEIEAIP